MATRPRKGGGGGIKGTKAVWAPLPKTDRGYHSPVQRAQERTCLYCGMPFKSWGPAKRRCGPCTHVIDQWVHEEQPDLSWMTGADPLKWEHDL